MTRFYLSAREFCYVFCCFILLGFPIHLRAECQVTLQWEPNGDQPDGYRLYERESGQEYSDNHYYDVGQESSCTVFGLDENHTYHFVVRAYVGPSESADSNEATYECTVAPSSDAPNPPNTPEIISPADGAQDVGLEPILTTSKFSDQDPEDIHAQTHWQIFRLDNDECVYDVISNSALTTMKVPPSTLEPFTTYYWTVSYFSQSGGKSAPAPASDFTTTIEEEDSISSSLISGGSGGGSGGSSDGIGFGCFIQTLLKGK